MGSGNHSLLWFLPDMGFQYLEDLCILGAKVLGIKSIEALNWNADSLYFLMTISIQRWVLKRQTKLL
jgi:hypothetical protein